MRPGFYVKMCIENEFGLKKIDLQLLRSQEVLLCIWRDWKDVVHYEHLPQSGTINTVSRNSRKTDRVGESTKCRVGWKIKSLTVWRGRCTLSSVLPSHIRLLLVFRVKKFPHYKRCKSENEIKKSLDEYFASKWQLLWRGDITKLPEWCEKVTEQNHSYITASKRGRNLWDILIIVQRTKIMKPRLHFGACELKPICD